MPGGRCTGLAQLALSGLQWKRSNARGGSGATKTCTSFRSSREQGTPQRLFSRSPSTAPVCTLGSGRAVRPFLPSRRKSPGRQCGFCISAGRARLPQSGPAPRRTPSGTRLPRPHMACLVASCWCIRVRRRRCSTPRTRPRRTRTSWGREGSRSGPLPCRLFEEAGAARPAPCARVQGPSCGAQAGPWAPRPRTKAPRTSCASNPAAPTPSVCRSSDARRRSPRRQGP